MRQRGSWLLGGLMVLLVAQSVGAQVPPETNVRLRGTQRSRWVRKALENAATRLSGPECGRILSEFRDAEGRTLQDNLDGLGVDASEYVLSRIFFYDAEERSGCRHHDAFAVTAPGSHVIKLCPRFDDLRRKARGWTEALLIHEALHTLGLEENPPSTFAITTQVLKHCR